MAVSKKPGTFAWSVRGDAWEISKWRLALGIIGGAILFFIADAVRYGISYLDRIVNSSPNGIVYSSDVISFIQSNLYFIVVGTLIVVSIVHNTIRKPFTVRGPLKMAYGVLVGLFYYFILAGGVVNVSLGVQKPVAATLLLSITLLVTLGLLEASALVRVVQGGVEFREGMKDASKSLQATKGTEGTTAAQTPATAEAPGHAASPPAEQVPEPAPEKQEAEPAAEGDADTLFCTSCGKPLAKGDEFCTACGAPRPSSPEPS